MKRDVCGGLACPACHGLNWSNQNKANVGRKSRVHKSRVYKSRVHKSRVLFEFELMVASGVNLGIDSFT